MLSEARLNDPAGWAMAEVMFDELRRIGVDGVGITREAYATGEQAAMELIDRTARAQEPARPAAEEQKCEYWKYCAIDGYLCACCGGTSTSCPPGTQSSPITWIGTCHNPGDGRDYIISYNDCCGKVSCGDCFCDRNEGEKPMYRLSRNNDVNWCMANSESNYHCSVSVILGVAEK